jgi:hypothetical protein
MMICRSVPESFDISSVGAYAFRPSVCPSNDYIIFPFLVTLTATVMIISSFVYRGPHYDCDQRQLPRCINLDVWFGTKAEQLFMQLKSADQQTKFSCIDQDLVLVRIRGLVLLYMQQNPRG